MKGNKFWCFFFIFLVVSTIVNCRPISPNEDGSTENFEEPGFWKRQFIRAGSAASAVGSTFGKTATRLTAWMDRICVVVKKIIPIVGAICTVGQFKFCALENIPDGFDAGLPVGRIERSTGSSTDLPIENKGTGYQPIDLNQPDK